LAPTTSPTDLDRYHMIRTYFQMLLEEIAHEEASEAARAAALTEAGQLAARARHRDAVGKMKQFASWFTHGIPNGSALRKAIFEAKSGAAVLDSVEAFFAAKTESRAARPDSSRDQQVCRNMRSQYRQSRGSSPDVRFLFPPKHLRDTGAAADHRFQIFARQSLLIHRELNHLQSE
jgi:hypothetical protein